MSLPLFLLFWVLTEFSFMISLSSALPLVVGRLPLFIVSFQGFRVLLIPPPLLPWVPEPVLRLSPKRLILSLFFIISSLWCCFFKSPWLTFHSRVCLGSSSWFPVFSKLHPFRLNFWSFSFFVIFPKWAESIPIGSKVFSAASLYSSSSWVPWGTVPLVMNDYPNFLAFLLHHWPFEKDISALRFLCLFGIPLELS